MSDDNILLGASWKLQGLRFVELNRKLNMREGNARTVTVVHNWEMRHNFDMRIRHSIIDGTLDFVVIVMFTYTVTILTPMKYKPLLQHVTSLLE